MKTIYKENFAMVSGEKRLVFKEKLPNIELTEEAQNELRKIPQRISDTKEKVNNTILANMAEIIAKDLARQGIDGFKGLKFNKEKFLKEMNDSAKKDEMIALFVKDGVIKYGNYEYFSNEKQKNSLEPKVQTQLNSIKNQALRKSLHDWLLYGNDAQKQQARQRLQKETGTTIAQSKKATNTGGPETQAEKPTETVSQNTDFSDEKIIKKLYEEYKNDERFKHLTEQNIKALLQTSAAIRNRYNELKKTNGEETVEKKKDTEISKKFSQFLETINDETFTTSTKDEIKNILKEMDSLVNDKDKKSPQYKKIKAWADHYLKGAKTEKITTETETTPEKPAEKTSTPKTPATETETTEKPAEAKDAETKTTATAAAPTTVEKASKI